MKVLSSYHLLNECQKTRAKFSQHNLANKMKVRMRDANGSFKSLIYREKINILNDKLNSVYFFPVLYTHVETVIVCLHELIIHI